MEPIMDLLFFFDGKPAELALCQAFLDQLYAAFEDVTMVVHKTQISVYNRHQFAAISMLRVRPKAEMPAHYIVITLGLPYLLESPRVAAYSEVRPRRWTHHLVVGAVEELDAELMGWVREAYAFANSLRRV